MAGLLFVVVAIAVLATLAFAVALARAGQRSAAAKGEVLPGIHTGAPKAWALAHTPEARMHRRLGASVQALQAVAASGDEDVAALELRVELEQHALAVDRRLVAAAALPVGAREQALAELEVSVATVESAAADLAVRIGSAGATSDVHGLEDLAARIKGLDASLHSDTTDGAEGPEETGQTKGSSG